MNHRTTLTPSQERKRLRQLKALKAAAGSWKDKDHPELARGVARWVRKMRKARF